MSVGSASSERGRAGNLTKSDIFQLLQNERRRYVIQYLRRHSGPVELGELATQVAAWEYDCDCPEISKKQRKRVYTTLQQTHLPKLDDVGIVAYDADQGIIERTPQTDELTVYLEIVPGREFPWREYYLSLGAVSLAILATLWGGIYPFTEISALVWATLLALVLTVSAAYHTFAGRELTLDDYPGASEDDSS
jgi:hypothetical protein